MSLSKKRKVDRECRVFKREWTTKYFFTPVGSKAVCLILQESVAIFKEHNICRHLSSKHASYASNLSAQERETRTATLVANLQARHLLDNPSFKNSQRLVTCCLKKLQSIVGWPLFSEGEFWKECVVETANLVSPESKANFENISLSRRTVTRRVELIDWDLSSQFEGNYGF